MAESNYASLKVNEMVDLFVPLYTNGSPKDKPTKMLWGPPGIGKSQGVRAFARALAIATGKEVRMTDVRLLLFNPVDLRGIPTKDQTVEIIVGPDGVEREEVVLFTRWLRPFIFCMDPNPDIINILFLDEISAAPQSVQAAAYQITLDRVVGEHKLPDNCIVIAAGNRVTDKSVAYKMPKALGNRMTHYEIVVDVEDFKRWAIPHGIDERIIGFINWQKEPALFAFDPSNDDVAFPSPRSWEMVDCYLKDVEEFDDAFKSIAGSIGTGMATKFRTYTKVFHKLPSIEAIFEGRIKECPNDLKTQPDVMYALSSALVAHGIRNPDPKGLQNFMTFTMTMSSEFAALTVKDIVTVESIRNVIANFKEWVAWSKLYKDLIM